MMKEIAVTGINGHVLAEVLSALLHRDVDIKVFVNSPERLMDANPRLTVARLDAMHKQTMVDDFAGYHDVIMTFDDNQTNKDENDFILKHYNEMVNAAREAGVERLVVVGSPQAEAFFTGDLKRRSDIDWVFVSTEGDFGHHAADEVIAPRHHREVFA